MKTSEFIKKIEAMGLNHRENKGVIQVIDVRNPFTEVTVATVHADALWACHVFDLEGYDLTERIYKLVTEYAETPLDDRKDERKWVIPWGISSISNDISFWSNFTGRPYVAEVDIDDESWKKDSDYQFTDSEIEKLKSTQTPAIAKAIDIAKELVSDEA